MLQQLPTELKNLFYGSDEKSSHFLENIRSYNAAFAFVSLGLNLQPQNDPELPASGPRQYKIKGELWHALGSLLPPEGKPPVYAQLYFVAPETALQRRLANNEHHGTGLDPVVMQSIHDCLTHENNFINIYKSAFEIFQNLERDDPESLATACYDCNPRHRRQRYYWYSWLLSFHFTIVFTSTIRTSVYKLDTLYCNLSLNINLV